ncbi:MAG: PAS domain S-box protein [Nitrospirae bacterium]|nr:PAS domain S-box protein [Nitrospirota bacterium]
MAREKKDLIKESRKQKRRRANKTPAAFPERRCHEQNEELRRAMEDLEESRSRYSEPARRRTVEIQRTNDELMTEITARSEAEERIKHLASFPQLNPNPVIEVDYFGNIIFANPATERFLEGLGMEKRDASVFLPKDLHLILADMDKNAESSVSRDIAIADKFFNETIQILPQFKVVRLYASNITERKRAEEALHNSEEFYRQTLESIPGMVFTTRADGYCDYQSQQWVDFTGVPMKEHLGDGWNKLLHPDDRPHAYAAWYAAVEGRAPYDLEYRVRRHDGEYEWFKVHGRPIRDSAGHIVRWFGTALNIDRLLKTQQALQASETKYRALFTNMISGFALHKIILDDAGSPVDYIFLEVNRAFVRLTGLKEEQVIGRRVTEALPGIQNDPADWIGIYGKVALNRKEVHFEQHNELLDTWFAVSAYSPMQGFFVTIFEDISERKRTEAALTESEERFRRIAETSVDLIFQLDPEGRITYCSPAIKSFGYEADKVLERSFAEFIPCDEQASAYNALQRVISGEILNLFELRALRPDNSVVFCEISATPIVKNGAIVGIQGIARDITDRKQAETELREAHDELEERVRVRTSELSGLNDDLEAEIYERRKAENRLARINALYSILFRVNEAIVRIHNPERLFEQTCRIVVDSGLFKMAWIGFVDPDTAKVKPVASAGDSGKYLDRITIIASDVPEGQGPTGRAIIEGKTMVCPDIENDPTMLLFREAALKEGFRSSASFPLRAGSTVIGAFNTYADSPRFFTDEEIKLLSSLVEDISFAIETMAGEKKRIEAEQTVLASAHEIEDLYNYAPCGYHSLDRDGRIVRVNDTQLSWMGYKREDVMGKKISDFCTEESRKIFSIKFPQFLKTGKAADLEFEFVRRDGSILPVSISATAVRDKDNNFVMTRTTVMDITERKARERQTEAANNVLKLFAATAAREDYLNALVSQLRIWCGCSAVGIRLIGEEDDVPFVACRGFSEGFIKQEGSLILGKDSCACTRVINGKPRRAETNFMTKGGSFVCNDTSDLCSKNLRDFYRHACIREGFSSLAVVPIRYRSRVIGAVHLADPQNNAFTPPVINFIEAITPLVGEALHRFSIEEELTTSREELRALSAHLQEAREEERIKIAREIHDELGQILTAAGIELSLIKNRYKDHAPIKKAATSVIGMLDNAVADIQRICEELRPRILDHLGLPVAIKQEAAGFTKRTGIRCSLDLVSKVPGLTDESAVALLRIVQEALTNAARHSGATAVSVRLTADKKNITLEVTDNGKGISRQELGKKTSLGLIGMRERVREINGDVTIQGTAGKGTVVTVRIPSKERSRKR